MKTYPSYKASGVEWLGDVPEHWSMRRLKTMFTLQKRPVRAEDEIVTAFRDGTVTLRKNRREDGYTNSLQEIGYQGVRKNDLVIHAMDGFAGAIGVSDSDGKSTPVYSVCTPSADVLSSFYGLLLRHMALAGYVTALARGVRERSTEFRWSDASVLELPFPPLPEQRAIAAFLDREVAKIDELIEEQRRLIALLAEKRQATISYAVTKGLNPNTKMKPSGIDWLGDIPEEWELVPLKRVATVQTGVAKGKAVSPERSVTLPYLRVANVQDSYLDLEEIATIDIDVDMVERYLLRSGDVLMNEGGDFDKLGRGSIWRSELDPCIHQNHVFAVRPHEISSEWLNALISSDYAKFYFMSRSKQSTNLASISSTNLMHLPVILPSKPEQAQILDHLSVAKHQFDNLSQTASAGIALLQERRSALISAAVTGKIGVRDLVPSELEPA